MGSDQFFFDNSRQSGLGRAPYGPDYGRWHPVNCQTWTSSDTKTPPCIKMDV